MNLNIEQFLDFIKNNSPKRFGFYVSVDKTPTVSLTDFWFENGKYYYFNGFNTRKKRVVELNYFRQKCSKAQFHNNREDFKYEEIVYSEDKMTNALIILENLRSIRNAKLSPVKYA